MKQIQLLALGDMDLDQVRKLAPALSAAMQRKCEVLRPEIDISAAFNRNRGQYSSTELLAGIASLETPETWRLLAIASADLYIPILTFVFGEAQLDGLAAIVSTSRLRQEFYGLPADEELLNRRLLKEAVHELGHTLGLTHCDDVECVMAASHAVEWIDLKSSRFCSKCGAVAAEQSAHCVPEPGYARLATGWRRRDTEL
ncbi:MAG TPA: archaemetzincin family Zn-dependent metalloprotease [Candidatus Limnocylindrales bacterium]|nr:archaemetzincin family Zn-dependent metalloprotease [Candidatus Limnocylindrales bacterium]